MDNIQDPIKQAVEEGYIRRYLEDVDCVGSEDKADAHDLQDLAFWQALGKARGWQYSICDHVGCLRTFPCGCGNHSCACGAFHANPESPKTWKYHALRYFDTLLSGGDMKAFWESLP